MRKSLMFKILLVVGMMFTGAGVFADTEFSTGRVTAQQRSPLSGLVDIVVMIVGDTNEIAKTECVFLATNCATQAAVNIATISQVGEDVFSDDLCTRHYLWNAASDIGTVKIDDLALTVDTQQRLGGVQLWENGPYWAECNVGATQPEEYGYYFWWGDTVGYKRNENNNGWVSAKNGSSFSFSKSNDPMCEKDVATLQSLGYINSTSNLVAAYDAAAVNLGDPWRMPTDAEFSALFNNCTTTWTEHNGVYGRLVTGKGDYADRSIFLPAAGVGFNSYLNNEGTYGSCWSSTPDSSTSIGACGFYFYSNDSVGCNTYFRYYGRSVRPLRVQYMAGVIIHCAIDCRSYIEMAFDANGGTCDVASTNVVKGAAIGELPIPTRENYAFLGWYTATEDGELVTEETVVFSNATFYARWRRADGGPYTETIENNSWTFSVVNGYASIESYVPGEAYVDIEIPSVLAGCIVTNIANGAFSDFQSEYCSTGFVIPETVVSIESYAFEHCNQLTSIRIPDSVQSIGDYAFRKTGYYTSSDQFISIGSGLCSVGKGIFSGWYVTTNNFYKAPGSSVHLVKFYGGDGGSVYTDDAFSMVDELYSYEGYAVCMLVNDQASIAETQDWMEGDCLVAPTAYSHKPFYRFAGWSCGVRNITSDLTVSASFYKMSLQEYFDWYYSNNASADPCRNLTSDLPIQFAFVDATAGQFRLQGTCANESALGCIEQTADDSGLYTYKWSIEMRGYDDQWTQVSSVTCTRFYCNGETVFGGAMDVADSGVKHIRLILSDTYFNEEYDLASSDPGYDYDVDFVPVRTPRRHDIDLVALSSIKSRKLYGNVSSTYAYNSWKRCYEWSDCYSEYVADDDIRFGDILCVANLDRSASISWAGGSYYQEVPIGGFEWIATPDGDYGEELLFQIGTASEYYCPSVRVGSERYSVVFDLNEHGDRTGGGDLIQEVESESDEIPPTVAPKDGWQFDGWSSKGWNENWEFVYEAIYGYRHYGIVYTNLHGQLTGNPVEYVMTNAISLANDLQDTVEWKFVGWSPDNISVGTFGELIVTAKWELAEHTILQLSMHGGGSTVVTNRYGDTVTVTAPTDAVWNGSTTNFVCLGSSSKLPITNSFDIVVTNDLTVVWDVWQTNYLFRTVENSMGTWYAYGAEVEQNAVADAGYRFYKWIGDVDGDEYENPKTFVMTQARYVEPLFVEAKVATPTISIPNGTVLSNTTRTVTMNCSTPGATIYYTLDGSVPSAENGTKYTGGGFVLNQTALIQAIAVKVGSDTSDVASAAVVHLAAGETLPKITITPESRVSTAKMMQVGFKSVVIPGLTVERRYTLDGTDPTADSGICPSSLVQPLSGILVVKAAMFVNGVRIGEVSSVRYASSIADVIVRTGEGCGSVAITTPASKGWTLDENEISPLGRMSMRSGLVGDDEQSVMTATFEGSGVIEFNWRTSCESGSWPDYDFYVDSAHCYLDGEQVAWLEDVTEWTNVIISVETTGSHKLEWTYEKSSADGDPYPGEDCAWVSDVKFSFAAYVNFSAGDETTGEPPKTIVSSAGYSVALPGCGDLTFAKHAFVGWQYGDDVYAEGESVIVDAQEMTLTPVWAEKHLSAPVIDVAAEYDEESTLVTITNVENVAIYYTTDGSEPTVESKKYNAPFAVVGTTTIKAIAIDDDWFDSPVATATTTRSWTTLEDCLGAEGFTLATGGDRNWIGDADEECVKSVSLGVGETSWLTATFDGAGVVEWWMKSPTNDWTQQVLVFENGGEHVLRWEGSGVWVRDLQYTAASWVTFVSADGTIGDLPEPICSAVGYAVTMPDGANLALLKHSFAGWSDGAQTYDVGEIYAVTGNVTIVAKWEAKRLSPPAIDVVESYDGLATDVVLLSDDEDAAIFYTVDGSDPTTNSTRYADAFEIVGTTTIKAIAVREDWFDSAIAAKTSVRSWGTYGDCVDNPDLVFTSGGSSPWCGDTNEVSCGSTSVRSGAIADLEETWIETKIAGSGMLSFAAYVEGEYLPAKKSYFLYDYLRVVVDNVEVASIGGPASWSNVVIRIEGDGVHTVSWIYRKDDSNDGEGRDAAWLDNVHWVADAPAEPFPDLGSQPTVAQIADVLTNAADARLAVCITNAANYNAYRDWAANVKTEDGGDKAGAQAVKESSNAWFSFAVGSDKLISELPAAEDIKVDEFVPSSASGKFDFTVSVDGVTVGDEASKENLKLVFGLEGSTSLDPKGFSSNNVDIDFDAPKDGKVRFTAGPKSGKADTGSFFMKVKVSP